MSDDTRPAVGVESEPGVRIEETFDAPRERVFDAWVIELKENDFR